MGVTSFTVAVVFYIVSDRYWKSKPSVLKFTTIFVVVVLSTSLIDIRNLCHQFCNHILHCEYLILSNYTFVVPNLY